MNGKEGERGAAPLAPLALTLSQSHGLSPRNASVQVYSYLPNMEDDPFSQVNLWSFNYFFFNR